MGILSEAARFHTAASPLADSTVEGIDQEARLALARYVDKAQQLETAWAAIARTMANRTQVLESRSQRINKLVCAIGAAGLLVVIAAQFYKLVPYEYAFPVSMLGVVLAAAPLVLALWPALREDESLKAKLLDSTIRARTQAAVAKRLAKVPEYARIREAWTPESRKALEWLIESLETDAGKLGKEMGVGGVEGRKHRRIVPRVCKVVVKTRDGRALTGNIADVSLSGVALSERLPRVAVKDEVTINGRAATVVRVWEEGVALEFKKHLDAATFDENLIL